jgi:hypothetical protein
MAEGAGHAKVSGSLCPFDLRKPENIQWKKYAVQNEYRLEMNTGRIDQECDVAGDCRDTKGTHRFHGKSGENERACQISDGVHGEPPVVLILNQADELVHLRARRASGASVLPCFSPQPDSQRGQVTVVSA